MSRTFSSVYKNNYSSDYVDILKMNCTKTCAINNYPIYDLSIYLTKTNAALTYLTIDDAALTYLTITDAALTYLTIDDASTNYLSRIGVATSIATETDFNGGDIYVQTARAGLGGGNNILNLAFGYHALQLNTTGGGNTAIGSSSLSSNTTGGGNTALGIATLKVNTTGSFNCCAGYFNSRLITTGTENTSYGNSTLYNATTASYNTPIGSQTMNGITVGTYNTSLGYKAFNLNNYSYSTALGASTVIGASTSTAIGYGATTSVANSIVLGTATETVYCPGTDASGSLITAADIYINGIRAGVGNFKSTVDASLNTCFGKNCLMTIGSLSLENSAFGSNALKAAISTNGACAFGNGSLEAVTTGDRNTAIGANALNKLTGSGNLSIRNTAVGSNALGNIITGSFNAVFGQGAGQSIGSSICNENTLIGYLANANSSGGSYNTFIGSNASDTVGGSSRSTALGAYSVTSAYYSTALGAFSTSNHQFSTAIGGGSGLSSGTPSGTPGATTTANHQIMLGTALETVVCPGTDASGSLVLYGGLTLQTTYGTIASTMLGFQLTNTTGFTIASFTTATPTNISTAGIDLTAGVWNIDYSIELSITGTTAAVSAQTLYCSLTSNGGYALQRISNSGITRIHSPNTYSVGDTPCFSGSFNYYVSSATTVFPIFQITFTTGTISGTGFYRATRIG